MLANLQASEYLVRRLRALLSTYAGADLPDWHLFLQGLTLVEVSAGERLYGPDEPHPFVYMVESGLFKAQAPIGDRLTTVFFAEEGDVMAPLSALGVPAAIGAAGIDLHPRSPSITDAIAMESSYGVTALDRSRAVRAESGVLLGLARRHAAWTSLLFRLAMMRATVLQSEVHWLRQSAEQRYTSLVARNPSLVSRVSQHELAMYLNVTDASLSRIIRRVRDAAEGSGGSVAPLLPSGALPGPGEDVPGSVHPRANTGAAP